MKFLGNLFTKWAASLNSWKTFSLHCKIAWIQKLFWCFPWTSCSCMQQRCCPSHCGLQLTKMRFLSRRDLHHSSFIEEFACVIRFINQVPDWGTNHGIVFQHLRPQDTIYGGFARERNAGEGVLQVELMGFTYQYFNCRITLSQCFLDSHTSFYWQRLCCDDENVVTMWKLLWFLFWLVFVFFFLKKNCLKKSSTCTWLFSNWLVFLEAPCGVQLSPVLCAGRTGMSTFMNKSLRWGEI